MNNDILIYSPLSTGVFFRISSINHHHPNASPSVLHRRPRSRDGPWKARSPVCGEVWGVYLYEILLNLKVEGAYDTYVCIYILYIHSNIYIYAYMILQKKVSVCSISVIIR